MFFKSLEVAIGIVFLYLLLTFVASAMLEGIAIIFNWRAKTLYETIRVMFEAGLLVSVSDIYANPLVRSLGRDAATVAKFNIVERSGWHEPQTKIAPSYMPASLFSAAVLETLMTTSFSEEKIVPKNLISASCPVKEKSPVRGLKKHPQKQVAQADLSCRLPNSAVRATITEQELSPEGFINALRKHVAAAQGSDALLSVLRITLATQGASIQAVRLAIEKWFNDSMDRASGWYKRRTQIWLLAFGLLIALCGRVDTIAIAQWLWSGDAARQSVMAAAQSYASRGNQAASTPTGGEMNKYFKDLTEQIGEADRQIATLQYPIGWYDPAGKKARAWSWEFVVGAAITAIAISVGSTFWFDALQNLVRIRGAGPKPAAR